MVEIEAPFEGVLLQSFETGPTTETVLSFGCCAGKNEALCIGVRTILNLF